MQTFRAEFENVFCFANMTLQDSLITTGHLNVQIYTTKTIAADNTIIWLRLGNY